jgi:ferredoxin
MSEPTDHVDLRTGDLTVRIDRNACSAFKDCIGIAPEAFRLDQEGIVEFVDPDRVDKERLIEACDLCPVNALHVFAADGTQLIPR